MSQHFDLIVRGGTLVDGSGDASRQGDIGIVGNKIAKIGDVSNDTAAQTIDATDCIVTPGFIDIHTHYDGQAIWSSSLTPSSLHGVTTVVIGNCGVGFAPCRAEDRELLTSVMEGVEDIPEVVMTAGLTWNWESFPEYLDVIDSRPHDTDIVAYIPHSALRVYAMGDRGARREPANEQDRQRMAALVEEAIDAGALGFATGSVPIHRTSSGDFIPTYGAAESELLAIAQVIKNKGIGVMQVLVDIASQPVAPGMKLLKKLAQESGQLITFSLAQVDLQPQSWKEVLGLLDSYNKDDAINIKAQVFPRPVGILLGHDLTLNPFRLCPSYAVLAELPLPQKISALRQPDIRSRLLAELPDDPTQPLFLMARNFDKMFSIDESPNYEPHAHLSIAARAKELGIEPTELAYDLLLEQDGAAMLYVAIANYSEATLDPTLEMISHPDCLLGLGDGGAHYGLICDASFPTFMLTHWARDRQSDRLTLEAAIRSLTLDPASAIGLHDRGQIKVGYKADLNVINHQQLRLFKPEVLRDLPSGGRRVTQRAEGFKATILNGVTTLLNDTLTGAYPGGLVRGPRSSPSPESLLD